jgi:hypothetical protein
MTKSSFILIVLALALVISAGTLIAQQPAGRARAASTGGNSAHETTSATFGGARDNRVTITYGRPVARGRTVFGQLVPYGRAWRLGSDEATLLLTQKDLQIGQTTVPAGAYTLYLVPAENGPAKLAISKKLGGWGIPVDETQDLARVDMEKTTIENPVEQLTIAIEPTQGAAAGTLKISWEKTQYSVPFTIK